MYFDFYGPFDSPSLIACIQPSPSRQTHLLTCAHTHSSAHLPVVPDGGGPTAMHLIFYKYLFVTTIIHVVLGLNFFLRKLRIGTFSSHFHASIVHIVRASQGKFISHPYPYLYQHPALVPACRPAVLSGASRILTQLVFGWGCQFPAPLPCAFYFRFPPPVAILFCVFKPTFLFSFFILRRLFTRAFNVLS